MLNDVGGYKYLIKLAESSSPLTNPEYYAQYIYDQYLRRELIATGFDIVNNAMKEDIDSSASGQIEEAEKRLYELSDKGDGQRGFVEFSDALTQSLNTIEKAYQREGKISGISTGLNNLDKRTRWVEQFRPDHSGRPSGDGQNRAGDQHCLQRRRLDVP